MCIFIFRPVNLLAESYFAMTQTDCLGKNTTKIKGLVNEQILFDANQFLRPISYWKLCLLCAMRAFCVSLMRFILDSFP